MMHKSKIIFANAEIPSEHDFQQIIRVLNFDSKRETANTKAIDSLPSSGNYGKKYIRFT